MCPTATETREAVKNVRKRRSSLQGLDRDIGGISSMMLPPIGCWCGTKKNEFPIKVEYKVEIPSPPVWIWYEHCWNQMRTCFNFPVVCNLRLLACWITVSPTRLRNGDFETLREDFEILKLWGKTLKLWNWRLTSWGAGLPLPLDDKAATALCEEGRFLLLHHSRFTLTRSLICGWAFFTLARKCGHGPGDSLEDWLTKWVEKGEIEEQSEESSDGCPAVSSQ